MLQGPLVSVFRQRGRWLRLRPVEATRGTLAEAALLRRGKSEIGLSARHDQGLRANNRAKNAHQPTRRRERKMQRFKSPGSAQRFLSIHAAVQNTFNVQRHLTSRRTLRVFREEAIRTWRAATAA